MYAIAFYDMDCAKHCEVYTQATQLQVSHADAVIYLGSTQGQWESEIAHSSIVEEFQHFQVSHIDPMKSHKHPGSWEEQEQRESEIAQDFPVSFEPFIIEDLKHPQNENYKMAWRQFPVNGTC